MRIAHVGPRLARQGGPAGYLRQLAAASARADGAMHRVTFPRSADPAPPAASPGGGPSIFRRLARAMAGAPKFYRPSGEDLRRWRGTVDGMMRQAVQALVADAAESTAGADADPPDVWFAHDAAVAESLLHTRRRDQRVWLMIHAPMPLALYLAWNWGVPEWDWRDVAALPDVRAWTDWEIDVWSRVDRVILPCAAAIDELDRIDPRSRGAIDPHVSLILTGVESGDAPALPRAAVRRRFGLPENACIGLYLGNRQPYRGFDTLVEGVRVFDERSPRERRALVAVAGPDRDSVPSHPRLRALGPVSDVAALLQAVDFLINVNRFSLFDLSTIEAAAAGTPLMLHAVGGNRTFRDLGCGAEMVDSLSAAAVADGLARMFAMPADRRDELGARSRAAYERHLTPAHLWRRHLELYDQVAASLRRESVV